MNNQLPLESVLQPPFLQPMMVNNHAEDALAVKRQLLDDILQERLSDAAIIWKLTQDLKQIDDPHHASWKYLLEEERHLSPEERNALRNDLIVIAAQHHHPKACNLSCQAIYHPEDSHHRDIYAALERKGLSSDRRKGGEFLLDAALGNEIAACHLSSVVLSSYLEKKPVVNYIELVDALKKKEIPVTEKVAQRFELAAALGGHYKAAIGIERASREPYNPRSRIYFTLMEEVGLLTEGTCDSVWITSNVLIQMEESGLTDFLLTSILQDPNIKPDYHRTLEEKYEAQRIELLARKNPQLRLFMDPQEKLLQNICRPAA